MPKIKEIKKILNALKVEKIGKRDVHPGIRMPGTYNPETDIVEYSEKTAYKVISQIRDEQGLSSINVLTKDGVPIKVCPYGRHIDILSTKLNEEKIQELRNDMDKFGYAVWFPNDKEDHL
jgi:hypothetical protein